MNKIDIKSLFTKYGAFSRVRVSKNQKIRFLSTLMDEFKVLGFDKCKLYKTQYKQKTSYIGTAGDLNDSEYLFVTYYDTPVKRFNRQAYHPFADEQIEKEAKLNYLVPALVLVLTITIYIWKLLLPVLQRGLFNWHTVLAVLGAIILMLLLGRIVTYSGIPNRENLARNTSSVVGLIDLAEKLTRNQKTRVAFAFVDSGSINYFGYNVLKELLGSSQPKVLLFDSVSEADLRVEKHKSKQLDELFEDPLYVYGINDSEGPSSDLVNGVETFTRTLLHRLKEKKL